MEQIGLKKKKKDQGGFIFIVNLITEHIIKIWSKILKSLYIDLCNIQCN